MKTSEKIPFFSPATSLASLVVLLAIGVAVYRLAKGLGAATNLNDNFPWGLWIGFDLLGGVAMAAGGFIIAGTVYLFNIKKYKPIARPAVLTAFLGYLLAVVALMLDLGHPYRIWHPAVMWQIHSIMFIVALHVIGYTTVLAIEFSPMLFERLGLEGPLRFVRKIMVGAVLAGCMLSVLHQSSLGAVYLIAPDKLSPLWYSSLMPYHFLVSAVMMGLTMVSFESIMSAKAFNHPPPMEILTGLARGTTIALAGYLVFKLCSLATGPGVATALDGSYEANMYLLEMGMGVVLPLLLLVSRSIRTSIKGLVWVDLLVISGVILNRMNIAITGMYRHGASTGASYAPSWMEVVITLGIVALGVILFRAAGFFLPLFPDEAKVKA
ncbi:MAG: NrfD/PsrC family molybdoenzyme membrane anchor subunit [Thermodesulfobacteriota bacterium]